jgi:hypothetical protein
MKTGVLASLRFLFAKNRANERYGDLRQLTDRFWIADDQFPRNSEPMPLPDGD